jgi:elongation factor 1-gamma
LELPIWGFCPVNIEATKQSKETLKWVLRNLENHVKTRTHIVGEKFTLADVAVASALFFPLKYIWDENFRKGLIPATTKWFEHIFSHPAF